APAAQVPVALAAAAVALAAPVPVGLAAAAVDRVAASPAVAVAPAPAVVGSPAAPAAPAAQVPVALAAAAVALAAPVPVGLAAVAVALAGPRVLRGPVVERPPPDRLAVAAPVERPLVVQAPAVRVLAAPQRDRGSSLRMRLPLAGAVKRPLAAVRRAVASLHPEAHAVLAAVQAGPFPGSRSPSLQRRIELQGRSEWVPGSRSGWSVREGESRRSNQR
ncbi:MAG: hypothetical protein ACI9VR_002345, partial [Cognaticolwellia sp.]